jgi:phenylacetate-CoA ligase
MRILLDQKPPRVTPPLRLRVEFRAGLDAVGQNGLREQIVQAMHNRLTIRPEVELVPAGTLPRTEKKQKLIEISEKG